MNQGFLRVAAASPEIRVADPDYNADVIVKTALEAAEKGVEVLVFPELCLTGYTCGDLFFQSALLKGAERALLSVLERTKDTKVLLCIGLPVWHEDKLYNVCAVVQSGRMLGLVPLSPRSRQTARYFAQAEKMHIVPVGEELCSMQSFVFAAENKVTIGAESDGDLRAPCPPSSDCAALVTVCLAASGETAGQAEERRLLVQSQSLRCASAYVYAGAGRGESTTDAAYAGHCIIAENGVILAESKPFADNLLTFADIDIDFLICERMKNNAVKPCDATRGATGFALPQRQGSIARNVSRLPFVPAGERADEDAELILRIQAEGLRKRMEHIGAKKLLLGVSGGLDSALALLVCLRALDSAEMPRKSLVALSMPGFGTSAETAENALSLAKAAGADHRVIDIKESVTQHLRDIGHDLNVFDAAYENAQARMRTMILMDVANGENGLVVGTGDLSEEALGWCTYNGDHMSMYGVNASVPKTLVKFLVAYEAKRLGGRAEKALRGILQTEISPELLPTQDGKIAQKTEEIIGSFELNDFFLYYAVHRGCTPQKVLLYAAAAFGGNAHDYAAQLAQFYERFFAAQFKRSCSPDGAKVGFSLSPRGDWQMPSDANVRLWLAACEKSATKQHIL